MCRPFYRIRRYITMCPLYPTKAQRSRRTEFYNRPSAIYSDPVPEFPPSIRRGVFSSRPTTLETADVTRLMLVFPLAPFPSSNTLTLPRNANARTKPTHEQSQGMPLYKDAAPKRQEKADAPSQSIAERLTKRVCLRSSRRPVWTLSPLCKCRFGVLVC